MCQNPGAIPSKNRNYIILYVYMYIYIYITEPWFCHNYVIIFHNYFIIF